MKRGEKLKGGQHTKSRALKLSSMRVILIQANVGVDKKGKIYTWVYTNYIDQRIRISKNECLIKRERERGWGDVMNEVIVFAPR